MNYKEALAICRRHRNHRFTWGYNTWINRFPNKITLDFYNNKRLITWYPSGRVVVKFNGTRARQYIDDESKGMVGLQSWYVPWSDRHKVMRYLPWDWEFPSVRYHSMIAKKGEMPRECPLLVMFDPQGELTQGTKDLLGSTKTELLQYYIKRDRIRDRPRQRGRYWRARARNLFRDKSQCNAKDKRWWYCEWRKARINRLPLTRPGTLECGCRLYRKQYPKFSYTVQQILKEPNATVRTAMIKIYGIDNFFNKVTARTISVKGDYKLLQIMTGSVGQQLIEQQTITALKMTCPSTGQIYVNLVPNRCTSVSGALDWMFNIRDFESKVGQQT